MVFLVTKTGELNKLAGRGSTESGSARGRTRGRGQRRAQAVPLQQYHQSAQNHKFPPLPPNSCSFLARCLSRNSRHDCGIYCETISELYSVIEHYYVTDRRGLPVELWEQETFRPTAIRDYCPRPSFKLKWRHANYMPTYGTGTRYPKPPAEGGIYRDDSNPLAPINPTFPRKGPWAFGNN